MKYRLTMASSADRRRFATRGRPTFRDVNSTPLFKCLISDHELVPVADSSHLKNRAANLIGRVSVISRLQLPELLFQFCGIKVQDHATLRICNACAAKKFSIGFDSNTIDPRQVKSTFLICHSFPS